MLSHGNIIGSMNLGSLRSDFDPSSVGFPLLYLVICLSRHLQIGSAKVPVHLARVAMCFISGLHLCCFHPFVEPMTCIIDIDKTLEVAVETIARFVLLTVWAYELLYLS